LIGPLGFSLAEREVRRAGLDYWPRVDPRLWPDWPTFEAALPNLGEAWFFSAEATRSYWEAAFATGHSTVLIFGKESTGLDAVLRQRYRDRLLGIPMAHRATEDGADGVRSLNLSTSVALAVYEVLRQRGAAGRGSGK
jgi:tRNA (cytidine/uridine-2'-O-)-methyltransferase